MKKGVFYILFCFFISTTLYAQNYIISGRVCDAENNKPLPFVNIVANFSNNGCISDIDGCFLLKSNESIKQIRASYVGYLTDTVLVSESSNIVLRLKRTAFQLSEVVILPGANPAHRIIDSVITHRKENDPFQLNSFAYSSYSKFLVTANIDSLSKISESKLDSNQIKLKYFFEKQHVFLMENLSERKFLKPSNDNETLIASRISGMNNTFLSLLMSQIQSFSFYKPLISISDKNYVNPISANSTNKYFFLIQDTIFDNNDTVFVISYRPRRNTTFDGLKGLLYIHTYKWALQCVTAEPVEETSGVSIRIKQNYFRPDSIHWFPQQLHTDIFFNINMNGQDLYGHGVTEISNVKINKPFRKSDFFAAKVIIEPDAKDKDSVFWKQNRPKPLSLQEKNTYKVIDSIGREKNLDKFVEFAKIVATGFVPIGPISLDIGRIYQYNDAEGNRFGIGLKTNYKVSKRWEIYGYYGYGAKDKKHKFAGSLDVILKRSKDTKISFAYAQDVREDGSIIPDHTNASFFAIEDFRNYLVNRVDYFNKATISFSTRLGKPWIVSTNISKGVLRTPQNILFGNTNEYGFSGTNYLPFNDIGLQVEYSQGKDYIQAEDFSMLLKDNKTKPRIVLNVCKSIPNLYGATLDRTTISLNVSQSVKTLYLGTFSWFLSGNFVSENSSLSTTFNAPSAYRKFTVFAPNSFGTMRMNEFYSNRCAFLYLRHHLNPIFGNKKFSPRLELITNIALGDYKNKSKIKAPSFKTLEHGYFESGVFLNDLVDFGFYTLGLGCVYRYGYYSFPHEIDNFAIKFSIRYKL